MDKTECDAAAERIGSPHEIRHHMSNSYALLRSIIRWSADGATSLDSYVWHLEGRIDAVARILSAVLNQPGIRFDLRQLIAQELHDQRASDGPHAWSLEGPPVIVGAAAAEVLALLFHELVTNSVEHGALGLAEGGELRVAWRIDEAQDGPLVRLDWVERGAPAMRMRDGFGTRVLDGVLRHQLEATAIRELGPEGVRIALMLPMRNLASADAGPAVG